MEDQQVCPDEISDQFSRLSKRAIEVSDQLHDIVASFIDSKRVGPGLPPDGGWRGSVAQPATQVLQRLRAEPQHVGRAARQLQDVAEAAWIWVWHTSHTSTGLGHPE